MGHAEAKLALQRLGLLLAAVASLSGAAACQAFAGQCVGMIPGGDGGGQHHVSLCGGGWGWRQAFTCCVPARLHECVCRGSTGRQGGAARTRV
jgi:hypothetical protein